MTAASRVRVVHRPAPRAWEGTPSIHDLVHRYLWRFFDANPGVRYRVREVKGLDRPAWAVYVKQPTDFRGRWVLTIVPFPIL